MSYAKKSLTVSFIDAIVVSIFVFLPIVFLPRVIVVELLLLRNISPPLFSVFLFLLLFLLFFISSLFIAKSSKREPISIFLYPFLKTDFATLKIPFILSLIACIVLFVLLLSLFINVLPFKIDITLGTIISSIGFLIMRVGLISITRPETSTKGGIIVLIIGLVGMWAFMVFWEERFFFSPVLGVFSPDFSPLTYLLIPSSIMAIIGGSLGIKRGEKYYANEALKMKGETGKIRYSNAPFVIPIISFIFAVVPVLTLVSGIVIGEVALGLFFFMFLPFAAISTTLNIVGTFKIWKETNPKKKLIEEILIIISWYLIVFLVGSGLLLFWLVVTFA